MEAESLSSADIDRADTKFRSLNKRDGKSRSTRSRRFCFCWKHNCSVVAKKRDIPSFRMNHLFILFDCNRNDSREQQEYTCLDK